MRACPPWRVQVEMPGFSLDCALELMRCEGHSELWDRACDVRTLLGWNRRGGGEVVITFRGTASFENVKTDLKVRLCWGMAWW